MPLSRALAILQAEKRRQRRTYANKLIATQEKEAAKQQLGGTVLGSNAENGLVLVQLDNGGFVSCQSISNGSRKVGEPVIVSIEGGKAWLGGMPR